MNISFSRIKHFFVSFPHHPLDIHSSTRLTILSSSPAPLSPSCAANREISTPEAPNSLSTAQGPSRDSHGPPTAQQGDSNNFLHTRKNVPELFDVFLASFKALQQLGTRWEARTMGQDPKSIEGIRVFPWMSFGSGLLQL